MIPIKSDRSNVQIIVETVEEEKEILFTESRIGNHVSVPFSGGHVSLKTEIANDIRNENGLQ